MGAPSSTKNRVRTVAEPNKHQARTEATLRELLDAAERIFIRDGFERAQLEAIASETGRTRGAVYAHFKSKQDLFLALLERRIRVRMEAFRTEMQPAESQAERRRIARNSFACAMQNPDWALLSLEFKLFALRNKKSHERLLRLIEMLSEEYNELFFGTKKVSRKQQASLDLALAMLRSIPSALVLESKFHPSLASADRTKTVLTAIFDAVMPEDEWRPRQTPRTNKSELRPSTEVL